MHEERKTCNGRQYAIIKDSPIKVPFSSMKLKQSIKDSLCYSELLYAHFRPDNPTLQEPLLA